MTFFEIIFRKAIDKNKKIRYNKKRGTTICRPLFLKKNTVERNDLIDENEYNR